MDKQVKAAIKEYYRNKLFAPSKGWPVYYFKYRSYSRWAAKEVLLRILKTPDVPAVDVVENFVRTLDDYIELSSAHWNKDDQLIFIAARETATDILDILTAMR